ncbi:substrate-binding protein [Paraburkholderia fungorum]|jgi:urea transport system substrate-binding protein|uniref:Substrate-binding protein n=1 Tax=Paraburkholderia fungorum TaxID=134537 RepID=A0AAP5UYM6_9BURK|nr:MULTISPECIES: substrate-binding protein [Paraburkholderia]MDR8399453.1 substrate-binding protein [Paraburkholderia sp. USG1]MDT8843568.1 substrate-binding protein [Paraburkholderia fungorum]
MKLRCSPFHAVCARIALAVSSVALCHAAYAADPIKIGIPVGLSGANSVVAPSVVQAAQLAVDEINAKGGVLGRQLALEVADDASGAAGAQKAYDSLIFDKKVNALIAMETSAARNGGLPIVTRGKVPFIYTSFYEGRSCNRYMYVDAWVPDQQVAPIVDYFGKQYKAKTFFLIGSDYAFGRGMLDFTKTYIEKHGGKVVGNEYLPMDGSDWTPIISKLQAAKPDAVITSTAGGAPNVTLTKQLRAAGVKIPYGNLAVDEGTAKSMGADADGIYISGSYVTNIDTPANKQFLAAMSKRFGADMKTPNDLSVPEYEAVYLYKAAVEKAGSVDTVKVIPALAQVSFDGPRGHIQMNKQRHTPLTMYLAQVQADGSLKVIESVKNVDPGEQCPNLK